MERIEKKVQTIQLSKDDATLMAHMYDLAWLIQGTIFNHYYDEWQLDKDELVDDTDAVMKSIHKKTEKSSLLIVLIEALLKPHINL